MSRSVALGLVVVAGTLALIVRWQARFERDGVEQGPLRGAPAEPSEPQEQEAVLRAVDEVVETEESSVKLRDPPAGDASQRTEHQAEWLRISGTVRIPGGMPTGEAVRVRAELILTSGHGPAQNLTAQVASDGSFALTVPEDTRSVRLALESRFYALPFPMTALPGEKGLVLEPCVYGLLSGKVLPPQVLETVEALWEDMEVSWSLDRRADPPLEVLHCAQRSPSRTQRARPDASGAFALPFVPAGVPLELHARNPFGPDCFQRIEPLAPAEQRAVEITLEPGRSIAGRVIDENGLPVEGVEVRVDGRSEAPHLRNATRTDAEGRFVFTRVPRVVGSPGTELEFAL